MDKTALLAIDFINDIVHMEGKIKDTAAFVQAHNVIENANKVMHFARQQQMPIVLVKLGFSADYQECPAHSPVFGRAKEFQAFKLGSWGTEFHEKLNAQPQDFIVLKKRVSAFYATTLEPLLRANQIQHLIITGVSTDMAVQTTAREAHDRDYAVTIVADACGAASKDSHEFALKLLQRVAVIAEVDKLLSGA